MVVTTLGFGCTMVLLGLIGIYVGKIFEQVKNRPRYIVRPSVSVRVDQAERPTAVATNRPSYVGGARISSDRTVEF
jgi:hypothetical protein